MAEENQSPIEPLSSKTMPSKRTEIREEEGAPLCHHPSSCVHRHRVDVTAPRS